MTTLLVNLAGIAVIGLIVWWFWLARPGAARAAGPEPIEVTVADGVYTPAVIEAAAGEALTLRFIRRDPTPCAEKVIFGDFGISADLDIDTPRDITLAPPAAGEFEFTCQMGMYRGRIIAR